VIESISSFLAALKAVTPQVLIGVAVFCGVLLFSSPHFVVNLGLGGFVGANRAYLGAGFIGSICILASQLLWWLKGSFLAPVTAIRRLLRRSKVMRELLPDEKAYLLRYITEQQNTQYFRIDDGIAQGLAAKHVIYQAASVGDLYDGFAYNLQPWARRYIARHPETLNGANQPPDPLPGGASTW
jgi:hypothetical protein